MSIWKGNQLEKSQFDTGFNQDTQEYWQKVAHELANNFAKEKADEFMRMFMQESGIRKELSKIKPWEEYDLLYFSARLGKYLALAYALGYLDGKDKKKLGKIYV